MATIKKVLGAICDATDAGDMQVGIYKPTITGASRNKKGDTTLTIKLIVQEFTPEDVILNDLVTFLAIGKRARVLELQSEIDAKGGE